MQPFMTRALRAVLLATVVGILGFGAREALGATRVHAVRVCDNYPMCFSMQECQECCQFLDYDFGTCTAGNACLCS
jgi:hypothetical protein